MAGLSISSLHRPPKRFRVDLHSPGFETAEKTASEDARRAKWLRKWAKARKGKRGRRALDLADRLDPVLHPETPQTPASARFMREQRIRTIGAVWQLVVTDKTGKIARFDVIKPGCQRRSDTRPVGRSKSRPVMVGG